MADGADRESEHRARLLAVLAAIATVVGLVLMSATDGAGAAVGRVLVLLAAPLVGFFAWRSVPDNNGGNDAPPPGSATGPSAGPPATKPQRTTKAGQSAGERRWFRLSVAAAFGAAMLLFWTWTSAMNETHCRDTPIAGVPGCDGKGPAARTLLGWTLLVATLIAVGLVMRRWVRRRRLVAAGWNFVRTEGPRADQGRQILRCAAVLSWSTPAALLLGIWAPDLAGGAFALGGLVYAVVALVLLPVGKARIRP